MKNSVVDNKMKYSSKEQMYCGAKNECFEIKDSLVANNTKDESIRNLFKMENISTMKKEKKSKNRIIETINKKIEKNNNRYAIVLIDLDDFKFINETFGYESGDFILEKALERLEDEIRENDLIWRHNGDEFIMFLENIINKSELEEILNRIMKSFYSPIKYKDKNIFINISAGVAVAPENGVEFYTLLKNADGALTIAKNNGKGNYSFYDQSISKEVNRSYDIQRCLRTAIENEELYIMFQPKVFIENKVVKGFEALLRWNSKELGSVSPAELIPIAEMTRLIIPIGTFVLKEVFRRVRYLLNLGHKDFKIAVNLSELQLRHDTILRDLLEFRESYDVDLKYIEIEITESILMKSFEKNIRTLKEIKKLGATIALDDFGTGYSSLNYLTKLPIDVLKIDRSFVIDLLDNRKSRCIVENIINLSHQLGIIVVAEGVEDREQVEYLKDMLCDIVQGYYFSKPKYFEDIVNMIGKEM